MLSAFSLDGLPDLVLLESRSVDSGLERFGSLSTKIVVPWRFERAFPGVAGVLGGVSIGRRCGSGFRTIRASYHMGTQVWRWRLWM